MSALRLPIPLAEPLKLSHIPFVQLCVGRCRLPHWRVHSSAFYCLSFLSIPPLSCSVPLLPLPHCPHLIVAPLPLLPSAEIGLSEDLLAFHHVATDFAAKELAPHAAKWDEDKIFPQDALRQAAALGFGGKHTHTQRVQNTLLLSAEATGVYSVFVLCVSLVL